MLLLCGPAASFTLVMLDRGLLRFLWDPRDGPGSATVQRLEDIMKRYTTLNFCTLWVILKYFLASPKYTLFNTSKLLRNSDWQISTHCTQQLRTD